MVPGATNICIAPEPDHVELSREFPGLELVEGDVGHSSMPRSPLVREVIDRRLAEVRARSDRG
jgi:hypothetical protein